VLIQNLAHNIFIFLFAAVDLWMLWRI